MPYIPIGHEKYDLLPFCREHGGEVFSYSPTEEIDDLLPDGETIIPFGYCSYEEYFARLEGYAVKYGTKDGKPNQLGLKIAAYIEDIRQRNVKEDWSIVQYLGKST